MPKNCALPMRRRMISGLLNCIQNQSAQSTYEFDCEYERTRRNILRGHPNVCSRTLTEKDPRASPHLHRFIGILPMNSIRRMTLRANEVTFSYGPRFGIRDLNLEAGNGAWLGLIGPNGSGKSTVLKLLAGLLPPDS